MGRLCLDGRDGIGDVIIYLDDSCVAITDDMGLERRGHLFDYLIVGTLRYDSVMRRNGKYKLKKGIARISNIVMSGRAFSEST